MRLKQSARALVRAALSAALAAVLLAACAAAETLPSADCFSPGTAAMEALTAAGAPVETSLSVSVKKALYIPDTSVLSALFSGLEMRVLNGAEDGEERTALSLLWNGESVGGACLASDGEGTRIALDGRWFMPASAAALPSALRIPGRFDRLPVEWIHDLLASLEPGGAAAFRLEAPCALHLTDGENGTRLDVSCTILEGEGRWEVSGWFLRGPEGSTLDEAEVRAERDGDNSLLFSYRAQLRHTGKGSAGGSETATIKAELKGKRGGYDLSGTANVTRKNAWTNRDGSLDEKITVSGSFRWRDKTPLSRHWNLGSDSVALKETIRVHTPAGGAPAEWTDDAALTVETDGGTFFSGGWKLSAAPAEALPELPGGETVRVTDAELFRAIREEAERTAARIYRRMDEKTKKRVTKGL